MVIGNALNSVAQQQVYVNAQTGSNTVGLGNGSATNPYATITFALASITTNSATNPFCILATGIFAETPALKPWVSLFGTSIGSTRVTGISLASTWNDSTGAYASVENINFTSSLSLAITGTTGTAARLTFNNCLMANIGFSVFRVAIADTIIFKNSSTGIFQIQDANGEIYSSSLSSITNAATISASGPRTLRVLGSIITGNATVDGPGMTVTFSSTRIGGNAISTNSGAIVYDADSIPAGTLAGSATPSPIVIPAIGGTGINNGTKTITLGGNLATSGAFSSTFTMTGATGVTFPTSGTLATLTNLSGYLPLAGGTLTGTLGLDGDPVTHIGIDWLGADQENFERVQNNFLQALAVVDVAGNQYWHVNSLTNRPKFSLDIETQINTPFIDTNVLATGTIYNSSATLSASASGGSVTGTGTTFPTNCVNGIIYWPSTQNYARITARNSATSLTIDTVITISSSPFVLYWGGITYNPQTNIFALSPVTSLVLGDGSTFTLSGAHATTLTTTGSTNVTLPTSGTLATTTQLPTPAALTKTDDTNVTLTLGGTPTTALLQATSLTLGWTGQLSSARGGTGANNTATSGTILRGNGTNFVPTTATYPTSTTSQQLIYSTAANTIGELTTANSKFPATNSSGTLAMRALTVNIQVITATGTYTPTTGMLYCITEIVGSGGGGGGVALTGVSQFSGAAGGSAGEYARGVFSAATIGASQSVTIGAAGTGATAGNNSGGNGNTTSFGALMTAAGGSGGGGDAAQSTGSTVVGPSGGGVISPGTGGSFRFSGGTGGISHVSPIANIINGGAGGQSMFSGGGGPTLNNAGFAAVGYGGGGSGASRTASQAAAAGGAGAPGVCIVTEYIIN